MREREKCMFFPCGFQPGCLLRLQYQYKHAAIRVCAETSHTQIYSLSPQFATKQTIDTSAISRVPSPPFSLISKFPCDSLFRSNTNTTTPNQLLFTGPLLNLHSPSLPVPLSLSLSVSLSHFPHLFTVLKHANCRSQA